SSTPLFPPPCPCPPERKPARMASLDKVLENNIILGRLLRQSQADRARKNERRIVEPHPPASGACVHCGTYHTVSQHWSHAHAATEAGACSYLRPCGPAPSARAARAPAVRLPAGPPLGEFPPWERAAPRPPA